MKRTLQLTLAVLAFSLCLGCEFISNTFEYKDKSKEFLEAIMKEEYDKGMELIAFDHEMSKSLNPDTLKVALANFRGMIVEHFGSDLEYNFMSAEKKFSTIEANNTPPNTTLVSMEYNSNKYFGVVDILFDDHSKKILHMNMRDIKEPIPNMLYFWLFGLIAICVPIFNIYMIVQIKRSDLKKKGLKYLAIIFLNVPAISYVSVSGLSFQWINFQWLLGISFGNQGYLNSFWTFGIPLGGFYCLWKLKQRKNQVELEQKSMDLAKKYTVESEQKTDDDLPNVE